MGGLCKNKIKAAQTGLMSFLDETLAARLGFPTYEHISHHSPHKKYYIRPFDT